VTVTQHSPATRARVAGWVWALGVGLCVALVLAGAYAGRHLIMARTHAAAYVGPPSVPVPQVLRELRPEAGASFAAPIDTTSHIVLVASSSERTCPPVGACGPVPPLDRVELVDIASGATLASRPLTGAAQQTLAVAVDPQLGIVALVTPTQVATFDAATLDPGASLALPDALVANQSSAAAAGAGGTLWLTVSGGRQPVLLGLDERSGQRRAEVTLANASSVDGPIYDAQQGSVLVLERGQSAATVDAFSATGGTLERQVAVPAGARLGPLDPFTGALYLYGPDGATYRLDLSDATSSASRAQALFGARALGWDASGGQQYVADAAGLRVVDANTGETIRALPIAVASSPDQPLVSIAANGEQELAVLAEHGTLMVVQAGPADGGTMTVDTAALVARATLLKLVPQDAGNATPQDPPFLTAHSFAPGPGLLADVPYMVRDPDIGWQSATPGTAGVSVAGAAGGAYDVTFTVTWTQHQFTHRHVSVLRVAPNGAVTLLSDVGDAMP
jgi:hypothetical protein